MTIAAGTQLSRYEIRAKIGAGGMGVVYRAFDPKLNREVAIKVLPATFSADRERLARFEREAQAASALNHPNILSVYDFGEHDGEPFVVSELLEGETLRDRLDGSPIPQRKALSQASQIAKGLGEAHARSIVHRDLKPENIFLTTDGRIKILDFGLAKLIEPASTSKDRAQQPTQKMDTAPGVVMGTLGYMSPEQADGKQVDYRSDIFSFGVVLYEMITGKRAFPQRESLREMLDAIAKEDPPPLSEFDSHVSPVLQKVVERCLEKKPEERFQSTPDLAFALEALSGASAASHPELSTALNPELGPTATGVTPARLRVWKVAAFAALLVAITTAAGALFLIKKMGPTPPPVYHRLTFRRGTIWNARFAPDGQTIVYSAAWNGNPVEIFTTRPESRESRSLGLRNADVLSISPSGELAVLLNGRYQHHLISRGTLARMPLVGGAPREILEDVEQAEWSPDGADLAVVRWVDGRCRLEYPIGKALYETSGYISHPRFSPKGDMIAFQDHQVQGDDRGWVAVVDLAGNKRRLTQEWSGEEGLAWSPAGDEIWFGAENDVHAVTLSGRQRVVARAPGNTWFQDMSRDGRILLVQVVQQTNVIAFPPGETKERDLSLLDDVSIQDLTADGRSFIFTWFGEQSGTNYASYLQKTDGSAAVRLGEGNAASFSPDGKRMLVVLNEPPQLALLPTGAGEVKRIERAAIEFYQWANYLPDGKRVLFVGREPEHGFRFYVQEIEGGPPRPVSPEGMSLIILAGNPLPISPDGRFFIAADAKQNRMVFSTEGGEPRSVPGLGNEDRVIRWSSDGRSLFVSEGTLPTNVYRLDVSTGRKELLKEIVPADPAGILGPLGILFTPDGKGYVYQIGRNLSDLYLVEGLK